MHRASCCSTARCASASFSRLLTLEAARLLTAMVGAVRIFDPGGLPLPDAEPESHPKVQELRDAAACAEGIF